MLHGGLVWTIALAFIFAWAVKAALLEPVAIASLMQVYFRTIEGQTPDPQWEARLAQVSNKFRELGARAAGWVPGTEAAGAAKIMIGKILILVSLAAVALILIAGIVVMAIGGQTSSKWSNLLMRYRVLAQAVAVAILMTVLYFSSRH